MSEYAIIVSCSSSSYGGGSVGPAGGPGLHGRLDVAGHGDQGRAVDRGVAGADDAGVELLHLTAYVVLDRVPVQ
ncbi:MAG: hypothetical protein ABGY41_19435, partial [Candidatus Poribacteria bacterium]